MLRGVITGFLAILFVAALMTTGQTTWAQAPGNPAANPAVPPVVPVAEESEDTSFLVWVHNASGVFGYTIFLASFIMVAVIVMLTLQLRREQLIPSGFVEVFEDRINNKDFQGAYETAKGDDSPIGRMMASGMGKLSQGYDKALEEMKDTGDEEYMLIDHKLGYLALIAAVAPMLGLLGTVQGMIVSFNEIAASNTTPKPKDLAFGISMALVTTLEGLVVAIPAMVANSLLKNRAELLMNDVGTIATNLMARFSSMQKSAPRAAGSANPAPPARSE